MIHDYCHSNENVFKDKSQKSMYVSGSGLTAPAVVIEKSYKQGIVESE